MNIEKSFANSTRAIETESQKSFCDVQLAARINSLAWNSSGENILVSDNSGRLSLFDKNAEAVSSCVGHVGKVLSAQFNKTGKFIASAGTDGSCKIWQNSLDDVSTFRPIGSRWTEHMQWAPELPLLLTSQGNIIRIWTTSGSLVDEVVFHKWPITALEWHPVDRGVFISCAADGICTWRLGSSTPIFHAKSRGYPTSIKYNRTGSMIACLSTAGLTVWNINDGTALHVNGQNRFDRGALDWSFGGQWLACCLNIEAKLWGFTAEHAITSAPQNMFGEIRTTEHVHFHRYDQILAMGDADGAVCIWRTDHKNRLQPVSTNYGGSPISAMSWSPLEHLLAVGYADGNLRLWRGAFDIPADTPSPSAARPTNRSELF